MIESEVPVAGASRGYSSADFDADPQEYIDKAVRKYAGNTFILANPEQPDAQGDESETGHQSFYIPKDVQARQPGAF